MTPVEERRPLSLEECYCGTSEIWSDNLCNFSRKASPLYKMLDNFCEWRCTSPGHNGTSWHRTRPTGSAAKVARDVLPPEETPYQQTIPLEAKTEQLESRSALLKALLLTIPTGKEQKGGRCRCWDHPMVAEIRLALKPWNPEPETSITVPLHLLS